MGQLLAVKVLGPFGIRGADGEQISLTVRKAQGVLTFLAIERRATRDSLANLFWGDRGEERARHNVRQVLSTIRSICGPIIEESGDWLHINSECCSVDATEFLQLAEKDDEASLNRCIEFYTGDLLEGTLPKEPGFQDWLLSARRQLRQTACDAIDRFAQLLMAAGEHEQAIKALNRRLTMDPACEPAHQNLMKTLARSGRRSDALRQYGVCVDALQKELGVQPDAETKKLFDEIRDFTQKTGRREPMATTTISEGSSETPRIAVLPFESLSSETQEYFVDGITEDIITALSRFHSLHVIARSSTFVYKNSDTPDAEISEALGTRFLVRGSVQRLGSRVRLNVQLLDGPESRTIWSTLR